MLFFLSRKTYLNIKLLGNNFSIKGHNLSFNTNHILPTKQMGNLPIRLNGNGV